MLKGVLSGVQRLENAMKKGSIRENAIITYWPFRDIYKINLVKQCI